ncbi:MAG: hypothetical protein ACTHLE_25835 [Agriterribacter sp.]
MAPKFQPYRPSTVNSNIWQKEFFGWYGIEMKAFKIIPSPQRLPVISFCALAGDSAVYCNQ